MKLSAERFCRVVAKTTSSPIDDYYDYSAKLLTLGTPEQLASSELLGRLLLLGLVSGVELYFKHILSGVLATCEESRRAARDQMLPLYAVDFYGINELQMGLVDTISFATEGEIEKTTKKLTGISIDKNSSVYSAIEEFETVCVLRHAAVHTRGVLSPGNSGRLGLQNSARLSLVCGFQELQDAGRACHSVVRAFNRFIFKKLVERWIGVNHLKGTWNRDKTRFSRLFGLFHSKQDSSRTAYSTFLSLRPILARRIASTKLKTMPSR